MTRVTQRHAKPPTRRRRKTDFSSIAAIDKAAQLLLAFAELNRDVSLVELGHLSGIPKPTAFRILSTLFDGGLVVHNEATQTYNLGFFVLRLADIALASFPLREAARPVMRRIRDAVNETVVLSVRINNHRFNIDMLESNHAISESQHIGVPIPLFVGAASRAMLAAMPVEERQVYLQAEVLAPSEKYTAPTHAELTAEIERIRRQGYATSVSEYANEGHNIAVNIPTTAGAAQAALHLSITRARFTTRLEQDCVRELKAGAIALAKTL